MIKTPHFHYRGTSSIPGRASKILRAAQRSQKKKIILLFKQESCVEFVIPVTQREHNES